MIAVPHLKSKSGKYSKNPVFMRGLNFTTPGKVLPFLAEYFTTGKYFTPWYRTKPAYFLAF